MRAATEERNAYQLAALADCGSPDSRESAGAVWLLRVASVLGDYDPESDLNDWVHEEADESVPIYTHDVWSVFVDLAAWQEDPTELGYDGSDMEQAAKVCLYLIAERLLYALVEADAESEES